MSGFDGQTALAAVAAVFATGFALELFTSYKKRPRAHALVWTGAMAAYALATWALVIGLGFGWTEASFKAFYFLGAIANVPLLAAGSVYLVLGDRIGRWFLTGALVWIGLGFVLVTTSPLSGALDAGGIPEGRDLFGAVGPRVVAAVSGAVGTIVIVGLAIYSAVRFWNVNRRLATGNVLIMLGVLAPAFGGTLTGLGESSGLAYSLLVGAVLLWSGYRVASGSRRPKTTPTARDVADETPS